MDPSKLPSMSRRPRPEVPSDGATPEPAGGPPRRADVDPPPPVEAGTVWLNVAIGAILLFVTNGPRNLLALATDPASLPAFTDVDGSPMAYTATAFFWTEVGVTAFALLLVVEGLLLLAWRSRGAAWTVVIASAAVGLFNLAVIPIAMGKIGFPLMNAVAAAFAGYVALTEWGRLKA